MERETIKIIPEEGKEFIFNLKPTIREERQIKNEMAELLGGFEQLSKLETAIGKRYKAHLDILKNKYSDEELKQKNEEILKLADDKEKAEDFIKLFNDLHSDDAYFGYSNLVRDYDLVYDYAFMSVMNISKPKDFGDFFTKSEIELQKLVILLRVQKEEYKKKFKN